MWIRCNTVGTPPPHRIHSAAAMVGDVWVFHGGRCPGQWNTTNATYSYDFSAARCCPSCKHVAALLQTRPCMPAAHNQCFTA